MLCIEKEQLHCCVLFQEGDPLNIEPVKSQVFDLKYLKAFCHCCISISNNNSLQFKNPNPTSRTTVLCHCTTATFWSEGRTATFLHKLLGLCCSQLSPVSKTFQLGAHVHVSEKASSASGVRALTLQGT